MTDREMLTLLVHTADAFRSTPIVDDAFCVYRDRFDNLIRVALAHLAAERPRVVCLCGSTRFEAEYAEAAKQEALAGRIVLSVGMFGHQEGLDMEGPIKRNLDALHLRKIELADEVFVVNPGGYIGKSTSSEIGYALTFGKPVRYLVQV